MTPEKFLHQLLLDRRIEKPNGKMLYQYRLKNEEYLSLRETLKFATEFGELDSIAGRIRGFPALFVLYAAEWWRREYRGGAWKWSSILDTFCEGGDTLNTTIRTACVERGFAYWGHRPEGTGKKFFGAIVAHGGLPLHFIGCGKGKLSDMMDAMLRQAARYHWDREQIIHAMEDRASELAINLQKQEVYSLIAEIILTVLTLKQDYRLSGLSDPVAELNRRDPDWRERFPLSLEDDAAKTLLNGLVKEAALQMSRTATGAFQVVRVLKKVGEQYALRSVLALPKKLAVDELKPLFKLTDLPRYFSIDIHANARLPFCTGRQTFGADSVTLAGKNCVLTGEAACAEHLLYLREQNGAEVGTPLPVVGGAELAQDQPWIFVLRDEQLQWVASGRVSVPEEEAWIALPNGWTIDARNGEADFVGHCNDITARQLYQVSDEVMLEGDGQRYRVRTKQVSDTSENYVWEGSRLPYSSSPPLVFLGFPKLYRYSAEGERHAVPKTALDWFVAGTQKRIEIPESAKGLVDVYLLKEGERQTRFRLTVLGSHARVNFSSGMSSSEGVIELTHWGNIQVAVDASDLSCKQASSLQGMKLQLQAGDTPPEVINMTLRWQDSLRELRLSLPFPSTGGRFFDPHGRMLREGSKLALHHLAGTRLRIFDRNPDCPKRYDLELTLTQNGKRSTRNSPLSIKRSIPLLNNGSAEIRLIDLEKDIEKLMSFSDELDATVKITLLVGNSPNIFVNVSRYETELERQPYSLGLPAIAMERLDSATLEQMVVKAAPLIDAEGELVKLNHSYSEGVVAARWETTSLNAEQGLWLVFPDEASSVFFRPTLWAHPDLPAMDEKCPLAQAVAIKTTLERLENIGIVLDAMSENAKHSSWELMAYLLQTFLHLPLSSLDVFRLLGQQPAVAALVLLRSDLPDGFSRRLSDELGVIWEMLSVDNWRNAIEQLKQYQITLLGKEGAQVAFPILLKPRLEKLANEHPALQWVMDMLLFEFAGQFSDAMIDIERVKRSKPLNFSQQLWRGKDSPLQNLLLRGHAEDTDWPERGFFEKAVEGFMSDASEQLKSQINRESQAIFWLGNPKDFKVSVANIPVLCAIWAVSDTPQTWWDKPEHKMALRKIKAFDPVWFEQAYSQTVATCLALDILKPR